MIQKRSWEFRVSCQVDLGELVFVSGSCVELGQWDPQNLFPLVCEDIKPLSSDAASIWSASVELPLAEVEYRFVIGKAMKKESEIIYYIKEWETDLLPRIITPNVSNVESPALLDFGYIGDYKQVDEGWLVKDSVLFLRLSKTTAAAPPVCFWKKKYKSKKCFLKVTPIDIKKSTNMDSLLEFHADESTEVELSELRMKSKSYMPTAEVSVLKEDSAEYRPQEQFGVPCTDEEFIEFRCRVPDLLSIGFLIDFYSEVSEGDPPQFIGNSIILSTSFLDTYGRSSVPITSPKHTPIGQLTVGYMVVKPLQEASCNLKISYARYWKDSWKGLEVGHRGAGNSYHSQTKNCSNIRENTIASLKHAVDNGADMVEFDVQLSKDSVAVIYHDTHALIALKHKKEPLKTDLVEMPIRDLTLPQLQALKIFHKTEKGSSRFSDEDFEDHQPFPSLERVLQSVPVNCGFNIEIKGSLREVNGVNVLQHLPEMNHYLDKILQVILENKSPRKIIFSCFHPEICTMVRMKQNLYPVLLLTQSEVYCPPLDDFRTRTVDRAILYASSANILGINVHTSDIISDTNKFTRAIQRNLVVFCWGDQNSDSETIRFLKEVGLHGIIYDKIDVYITKKSKRSQVFLCDDKETCRCFPSSCRLFTENGSPQHKKETSFETGYENGFSTGEKRSINDEDSQSKRLKNDNLSLNGTSPSFCGILKNEGGLVSS